jgi:general stress protein 26
MGGSTTFEDALGMLGEKKVVILATCSGNGPALRPMTILLHGGAAYMLTFSGSPKVAQIVRSPACQVYADLADGDDSGFVRLSCRAEIVSDGSIRSALFESAPYAKTFWKSPEDESFCLLRLVPTGGDVMKAGEMYSTPVG